MKNIKFKLNAVIGFFLFLGLSINTSSFADDIDQLNHISQQIQSVHQSLQHSIQYGVMLGADQSNINRLDEVLTNLQTVISHAQKNNMLNKNRNINLLWQDDSMGEKQNHLFKFNAGTNAHPVYICRAPFLGATFQTRGIYPGQLTDQGCLISFAGYAFFVSHYQVLVNSSTQQSKNLAWLPIEKINTIYNMKDIPQNVANAPKPLILYGYNYLSSMGKYSPIYNTQILEDNAKPIPIAGGFERFRPVYICRTNYQDMTKVGKWVNYGGSLGNVEAACDIGFQDKEIVVSKNYELLMAMP